MESGKRQKLFGSLFVNLTLLLLVLIWTVPTMGIFVSSFRNRDDIATSGWWKIFPYRDWQPTKEIDPKEAELNPDGVMEIEGVSGTFEEFRAGVETPNGERGAGRRRSPPWGGRCRRSNGRSGAAGW